MVKFKDKTRFRVRLKVLSFCKINIIGSLHGYLAKKHHIGLMLVSVGLF